MYWSYPSLAQGSTGPSQATSTASFKTALEHLDVDAELEQISDESDDDDDDVSFASIPTSKQDLNEVAEVVDSDAETKEVKNEKTEEPEESPGEINDARPTEPQLETPDKKNAGLVAFPQKRDKSPDAKPLGIKRFEQMYAKVAKDEKRMNSSPVKQPK